MKRLVLLIYLLAWLSSLAVAPRWAAAQERDDPRARQFFEFGAQAYSKGQYLLAIDAFEQAYALTERPGLLFSLAQAHQRQFRASGDEQHLAQAIDSYRKYLARVPSGGRRADAEHALNTLLASAERLRGSDQRGPARAVFGRLLLSSSTPSASLTVNGETVESLPTALELPAEKYRVVATAKGFETRVQEIVLAPGSTVPLNLELEPLPALLHVTGAAGAEVLVDGRVLGSLPLGDVASTGGEHWVSLRKSGYKTRSVRVRLEQGQTAEVRLVLERTFQRNLAAVVGGGAGIAGIASVTLALLSWQRDASARKLAQRLSGEVSEAEAKQLNRDVEARNQLRSLAVAAGVVTAAMLGGSLLLYAFDTPAPPTTAETTPSALRAPGLTVTALAGPAWGAAATLRF